MKERVLITGASGFIGYHLIEEALKNKLEVYAAVRKSSKTDHLKKFDIHFVHTDFSDVQSMKNEIIQNRYDYIIHAAGATKARSFREYNLINAEYTRNLAGAVSESGIPLKKLVLISSLAASGPLNTLDGTITEETTPRPVTSYGKSKLLAEEYLQTFKTLNYTILRPTAVYGPNDKDIYLFFKQLANRIEPYIGAAEQKLSFIYATDLATATLKALFKGNKKTFNLSDGNFYSRYELANLSKEVLRSKTLKFHLPVNFVKIIAVLSEKFCSLTNKAPVLNREKLIELTAVNWSCSIAHAEENLNFKPEYDLKAGVKATLTWYKAQKWL